jgi:hypothetical protein
MGASDKSLGGANLFASYLRIFALLSVVAALSNAEPGEPVTPASFSQRMALHLFQSSGSPVVLRRVQSLTECQATESGEGVWIVPPQDVVTEFVYGPQAICVSVFVRAAPGASDPVRLDPAHYKIKFGSPPTGEYSLRQRLALFFPSDSSIGPGVEAMELFFRRVARPVNLDQTGSLASAMKDVDSTEAAAKFAGEVIGKAPRASSPSDADDDFEPDPGRPAGKSVARIAVLLLGIAIIGGAGSLYMRHRARQAPIAAQKRIVEAPQPVGERPANPAPAREGLGRRMISLPVASENDKKLVSEIDSLILDLTRKAGFKWKEVEEITKQAQKVSAMAEMEQLPVLEIVREFLKEQIKTAHLKRGSIVNRNLR